MLTVHPQFVVDGKHRKKAVILSLDEWKQIVEALEELDDIQAYDSAKESEPEKITFEQAVHTIIRQDILLWMKIREIQLLPTQK